MLTQAIPVVRGSVVAILRLHPAPPKKTKKGKIQLGQVKCSFGSGVCIAKNQYLLTAYHVLSDKARDPKDRFYAFTVPENGHVAHHFPVVAYPVEKPELDLALLQIGPCATPGVDLPALPVSFAPVPDGTAVVTVGFPAPVISNINIGQDLSYNGGQFFLKSHANEGIVAASYVLNENRMYEVNVGWHHGESGGPIAAVGQEPKVFSLMQHYRNVQSPHGVVAGPHRGLGLDALEGDLAGLGIAGA